MCTAAWEASPDGHRECDHPAHWREVDGGCRLCHASPQTILREARQRANGATLAHEKVGKKMADCVWTEADGLDYGDYWESACGETWSFIDGGPTENHARFCHGCGGRIVLNRVCRRCDGDGTYEQGGADIESDPPIEMTCDACHGTGRVMGGAA